MVSAITNQGTVRFHLFEGTMNAQRFIMFLKRLIKDAKRKVFSLSTIYGFTTQDI